MLLLGLGLTLLSLLGLALLLLLFKKPSWLNPFVNIALLLVIGLLIFGLTIQLASQPTIEISHSTPLLATPELVEDEEELVDIQEDLEVLLITFQQAVEANPNDAQSWGLLAQIYTDSGEFKKAAEAISQMNRIDGPNPTLYAKQAQALYFANPNQVAAEVEALLAKAFELDLQDPLALSLKGTLAYRAENWEGARQAWEAALPFADKINAEAQLLDGIQDVRQRLGMPAFNF